MLQQEALYPFSTVRETVEMSARLRMGRNKTLEEKQKRAEDVRCGTGEQRTQSWTCAEGLESLPVRIPRREFDAIACAALSLKYTCSVCGLGTACRIVLKTFPRSCRGWFLPALRTVRRGGAPARAHEDAGHEGRGRRAHAGRERRRAQARGHRVRGKVFRVWQGGRGAMVA